MERLSEEVREKLFKFGIGTKKEKKDGTCTYSYDSLVNEDERRMLFDFYNKNAKGLFSKRDLQDFVVYLFELENVIISNGVQCMDDYIFVAQLVYENMFCSFSDIFQLYSNLIESVYAVLKTSDLTSESVRYLIDNYESFVDSYTREKSFIEFPVSIESVRHANFNFFSDDDLDSLDKAIAKARIKLFPDIENDLSISDTIDLLDGGTLDVDNAKMLISYLRYMFNDIEPDKLVNIILKLLDYCKNNHLDREYVVMLIETFILSNVKDLYGECNIYIYDFEPGVYGRASEDEGVATVEINNKLIDEFLSGVYSSEKLLALVTHECVHVQQQCSVDSNILTYDNMIMALDDVLEEIHPTYYSDNYDRVLCEVEASSYQACTSCMLKSYSASKKDKFISKAKKRRKQVFDDYATNERIFEKEMFHIFYLFEQFMEDLPDLVLECYKVYPILSVIFDSTGHIKSEDELLSLKGEIQSKIDDGYIPFVLTPNNIYYKEAVVNPSTMEYDYPILVESNFKIEELFDEAIAYSNCLEKNEFRGNRVL